MARELNINITTTADFDEIEKLAQAFDKLEKSVKSLNNVKGLTGIEKSFKSAQTSIKNMTTDVKALDKALTSVNKKLSAQSRTNVSGNVAKQQQNAATQAARAQQKVVNDAIKAQTAAYNAAAKSQKQQAAAAATATKNAAKAQAAAYTQQDAAVKRLSSSMSKMYRLQDRQQGVAGSSNTLLNRMEQTEQAYKRTIDLMNKSWNTTDAGAQSAVQRGLSRSLGEFNAQLKQTQQLQNVWTAQVRSVQRYRDELSKAEKDAQQFVQKQTAAASSAKDAPTRQQALDDVTKGMQQIESIQRKIQELDRQSASGNEYFDRLGREAQRYTKIIEQAGQAQAAYHQRLQDLRTAAAQNEAAWDRMTSNVRGFITGLSSAAAAVASFAANMRGKLNAAFSSASQLAGSLSSSIGGKFASMRATLDSTGKTFLGFGKSAKTGMSQANVALNEFFSAGWSMLASGSLVRMFGQNMLGGMYRGLADYQKLEQQMVRLGISGGMWNVKDANENIDAQASNRAASSVGAMLPLEDLIFGIQSGRTRRVDPNTGAVSYEQGKGVRQFDTGQIADALYYFSSAVGADLRDQGPATAEALKPLLRVASFTQTDPETVIKGTLNAMMEFGYDPRALIKSGKTDTFDQVAGMVAIASNVSSMEVQDVFESFKMMGPLLNKLSGASEGAGLEDAMAAIFMASEVGLKGGNVGRGLDRLVSQLLDPDGPMQGVIKKYFGDDATMKNLFFNKDGTLQGGLKGVFDKIISKGLPEPELASLLSQLFTQNASRAAVGIIDPEKLTAKANVEGSWAWFKEQMKPENVERFMSTATAAMENTVSASITNMGNAWTMVKTMMVESVRGDLISGFTKLADVIWDIGYALRDNPAIARFIGYLGAMVGLFTTIVGSGMVLGGTILLIARAFSMLGGMISPVLKVLMVLPGLLLTIAPILLALGLAAGILYTAWNENLGGLQTKVMEFVDGLSWAGFVDGLANVAMVISTLGEAFMQFIRGPLLGLEGPVNALQGVLQRFLGTWLGNLALDKLFDMGTAIREFFLATKEGEGALGGLKGRLQDIQTVALHAGDALRGLGELFFFGQAQGQNIDAIQKVGDALGIEEPLIKSIHAMEMLHGAFNAVRGMLDEFVAAWKGAWDALKGTGIDFGELLTQGLAGAFAFMLGIVNGFIGSFTTLGNIVASVLNGISSRIEKMGQAGKEGASFVDRIAQRFESLGLTVTNVMGAIGTAIGVYLGARLVTALLPGFQLFASLGLAAAQFGVRLVGIGAQVALFGVRVVTNLALIAVQLAAQAAGLAITGIAWAAETAYVIANTAAKTAGAGISAASIALRVAEAAATLMAASATAFFTATLLASAAAFGAVLLAAAGFAAIIFVVLAATQGLDAAFAGVVAFLDGFVQGLMIGVGVAASFAAVVVGIAGPVFDFIASITGADSAIQAFGLALGLLATVALFGVVAALGGLIATLIASIASIIGIQGAVLIAIAAFGQLGFGLIGLGGPFETVINWVQALIDKFGVLGVAATAAILTVGGRAALGGLIALAVANPEIAIPAALLAGGAYIGYKAYQEGKKPSLDDPTYLDETIGGYGSYAAEVQGYGGQWTGRPGNTPQAGTPEWDAMMSDLVANGAYTQDQVIWINEQPDPNEAFTTSWNTPNDYQPQIGQSRYIEAEVLRDVPKFTQAKDATPDAIYQAVYSALLGSTPQMDATQTSMVAGAAADAANARYIQTYDEMGFVPNLSSTIDVEPVNQVKRGDTMGEAQAWLDDLMSKIGVDGALDSIAQSQWVQDNAAFLSSIGIDPVKGDWIPDIKKLTEAQMADPSNPIMDALFPGMKDYVEASTEWENWMKTVEQNGGDAQAAMEQWWAAYGEAPPSHAPDPRDIFGDGKSLEDNMKDQQDEEDKRDKFLEDLAGNFKMSDFLAPDLVSGLSAVFGRTSAASALGAFSEGIMGNIDEETLKANPWFNQDELMANAAISMQRSGASQSVSGKNLPRMLGPFLQSTADELGVSMDSLLVGLPQYYFDPSLLPTAQTAMFSALTKMTPDQGEILDKLGLTPQAGTGKIFSEMGLDWAGLTQYAVSTAMEGKDWNLSHYLMDAWDISLDDAEAYIRQNGLDPNVINSSMFEGVEAGYLSSGGQVAALTEDMWNWLADVTQNGTDNIIDITRSEFEKIPEAARIVMSNMGFAFNIVDDDSITAEVEKVQDGIDAIKNASQGLKELMQSPGVSTINARALGEFGGASGDSFTDMPGMGNVEQALNFNAMIHLGLDNDDATKGLIVTQDLANGTVTVLNELDGTQVTIPAAEFSAFQTSMETIQKIIDDKYQKYLDVSKPGSANDPYGDAFAGTGGGRGVTPMSKEDWIAGGAEGLIDENGNYVGPKLSPDESATVLSGGIDWEGGVAVMKENTLAAANTVQSTWSNSFSSDTQMETSFNDAINKALTSISTDTSGVEAAANNIASNFRAALSVALSGGGGGEDFAGQGARDSILGGGQASGGGGTFATIATEMVTEFQASFQSGVSNITIDFSSIGSTLTSNATTMGTTAGAAFAAAFAAASTSGQPPSNNGTQDPAIAGQDLGTTGPQPPTITVKVDMDHSLFDTGNTIVDTALDQIVNRQPKAKINMDHSLFDAGMLNVNLALGDITEHVSSAQVWMDGTIFFAGVYNVQSAMTSMGAAIASPQVWMDGTIFFAGVFNVQSAMTTLAGLTASPTVGIIDNASGPLGTISDLLNGLTDRTVTVTTNYQTTGSPVPSGSGAGAATGIGGAAAEGGVVTWSGLTVVGEEGWELMDLPRGTRIYDHDTSKSMVADTSMLASSPFTSMKGGAMSAGSTSGVQVNIYNPVMTSGQNIRELSKQVSREIGKQIEATNKGQSPRTP